MNVFAPAWDWNLGRKTLNSLEAKVTRHQSRMIPNEGNASLLLRWEFLESVALQDSISSSFSSWWRELSVDVAVKVDVEVDSLDGTLLDCFILPSCFSAVTRHIFVKSMKCKVNKNKFGSVWFRLVRSGSVWFGSVVRTILRWIYTYIYIERERERERE
jgi:hypothetical protein